MRPYLNRVAGPLKIKKRITNALDPVYIVIPSKVFTEKEKSSINLSQEKE